MPARRNYSVNKLGEINVTDYPGHEGSERNISEHYENAAISKAKVKPTGGATRHH